MMVEEEEKELKMRFWEKGNGEVVEGGGGEVGGSRVVMNSSCTFGGEEKGEGDEVSNGDKMCVFWGLRGFGWRRDELRNGV